MPRERWTAGADGTGHLHRGREPRAACGQPAIGEQFGWPVRRRCLECLATVETSLMTEAELMRAYGVEGPPIG